MDYLSLLRAILVNIVEPVRIITNGTIIIIVIESIHMYLLSQMEQSLSLLLNLYCTSLLLQLNVMGLVAIDYIQVSFFILLNFGFESFVGL